MTWTKEQQKASHDKWMENNPGRRKDHLKRYNNTTERKVHTKKWWADNKERMSQVRADNKALFLHRGIRSRAKRTGVRFELEVSDIIIPEFCPVLGIKIMTDNRKQHAQDSPSVDRIIPELGYVKGNVRIISNRANHLKSNGSPEELAAVAQYTARNVALMRWRGLI